MTVNLLRRTSLPRGVPASLSVSLRGRRLPSSMMNVRSPVFSVCVGVLLAARLGVAQSVQTGSIGGRVVDARTGAGLSKVMVVVEGTGPATLTDDAGAFVLSGVLYLIAGIATGVATFDAGLNVFLAWLTCATASVGVYATIRTVRGV